MAILGPRQIGKTTLAKAICQTVHKNALYLDLERPPDLTKLAEPEFYLGDKGDQLVIIDEIKRFPNLFPILRSLIDDNRQKGFKSGQFLLLGSASDDLLHQPSESLAGRIAPMRNFRVLIFKKLGQII